MKGMGAALDFCTALISLLPDFWRTPWLEGHCSSHGLYCPRTFCAGGNIPAWGGGSRTPLSRHVSKNIIFVDAVMREFSARV